MPSSYIVSELELFEVNHAVQNTQKEIATRFDFRGQDVSIEINEKAKEIKISTESGFPNIEQKANFSLGKNIKIVNGLINN